MVTRRELLEQELSPEAAERAIRNAEKRGPYLLEWLHEEAWETENVVSILKSAFVWGSSPEGHNYWHSIMNELISKYN